jgi:hypothetical protein
MVQAVKFIRAVIEDTELGDVQLTICTNGTLHHRNMDTLVRKRKLQLAISLDTIGEEFEQIRVGASWNQIERNILMFLETGKRLGYPWRVQAPAMLLKTNVPRLPLAKPDGGSGFTAFRVKPYSKVFKRMFMAAPSTMRSCRLWTPAFSSSPLI